VLHTDITDIEVPDTVDEDQDPRESELVSTMRPDSENRPIVEIVLYELRDWTAHGKVEVSPFITSCRIRLYIGPSDSDS
jgi:hypothetical protein